MPPDIDQARSWYPAASDEELARIASLVEAYCDSDLAARVAALPGAAAERPFAFEHDGVLLHGRLDVLHLADGRAVVADYKTNVLEERTPAEVVESDYHVQRLVYALACFRADAKEVEVVYQFLERPDETVSATFTLDDVPGLEHDLSAAIAPSRPALCPRRASSPAPAVRARPGCAGPSSGGGGAGANGSRGLVVTSRQCLRLVAEEARQHHLKGN